MKGGTIFASQSECAIPWMYPSASRENAKWLMTIALRRNAIKGNAVEHCLQSDTSIMSLNLFDVPDVDYRYEASRDLAFQPALTGRRPITFSIQTSDDYYDLNELRIQVKERLTDPAAGYQGLKANLADSDANNTRNTYCVNNFGHTIFRDINMSMNGVFMTEQRNSYHYRAYLDTLLNYNREGATKLAPQGWVNQRNVIEKMGATGANSETPTNSNWKGNAELRAVTSRLLSEN